jgi:hypothetical protein
MSLPSDFSRVPHTPVLCVGSWVFLFDPLRSLRLCVKLFS